MAERRRIWRSDVSSTIVLRSVLQTLQPVKADLHLMDKSPGYVILLRVDIIQREESAVVRISQDVPHQLIADVASSIGGEPFNGSIES